MNTSSLLEVLKGEHTSGYHSFAEHAPIPSSGLFMSHVLG